MIPPGVAVAADVYKAGVLAGHLWRAEDTVTFAYRAGYDGARVASTLPLGQTQQLGQFRLPAFFAGLLPEGETRLRQLTRSLHVADDDELGLLARIGADTIGDVQILPAGEALPVDDGGDPVPFSQVSFAEMWQVPERVQERSSTSGVQPKLSHGSRSLIGGKAGRAILKFSPDAGWHGLLENEALFMAAAASAGLSAPRVEVVTDRDGVRALAVDRFDRSYVAGEGVRRHAQEDAAQVMGLRPAQKYDPDARAVIRALSQVCAAPPVAVRDLVHQMLYSYVVGNNDLHAKNLAVQQHPRSGLWQVTPVYDVLHTWPYESDHRFHPVVTSPARDVVPHKQWVALSDDVGLRQPVFQQLVGKVVGAVGPLLDTLIVESLGMPAAWVRDVKRRISRRARELQ